MRLFQTRKAIAVGTMLAGVSQAIPYSQYILAPASRTLHPVSVYRVNGSVLDAASLAAPTGSAVFQGKSAVTYDYSKNIGGLVAFTIGNVSSNSAAFIGVTFSESSVWINGEGSDSTADAGLDTPLWFNVELGGSYTPDSQYLRGGFRYLSIVSNTSATVEVTSISVNFTAAPVQDLQGYTGYFHSNDEQLNRIYYAGAYTNQLCTIDPTFGNSLNYLGLVNSTQDISLPETVIWYSNTTITNGSSCLVDGAKRDRLVWPGDMVISAPSMFVSTGDLETIKNSVAALLLLQKPDGMLPYASYPFANRGVVSFTYHLHNLIAISLYYQYSGDVEYLADVWDHFTKGLAWSLSYIDDSGLMNVTSSADWLRVGMGGHNIEANAILYYTLNEGIKLAAVLNDTTYTANWTSTAATIKVSANLLLWVDSAGLYKDNETTTLMPQDGNAWAIKSNLTANSSQITSISSHLQSRWGQYGAPAPEAGSTPATISPFVGGFELEAHFLASQPQAALDLMRIQWGDFMLDDVRMTNSTFIEGYSADGSLHYAPYTNDPRISHAHGWATGPTSLLAFYVAGLHLDSASGQTWMLAPQIGDLTSVDAGYSTDLGFFSSAISSTGVNGSITSLNFTTPIGTSGSVSLPGVAGSLKSSNGTSIPLVTGTASNVPGGNYTLVSTEILSNSDL